jgi:membrane dipeptidase
MFDVHVTDAQSASPEAHALLRSSLVWDNHSCMPLRADDDFLPQMERFRSVNHTVVTLNVGFDITNIESNFRVLAHFRHWVHGHSDRYMLIKTVADIQKAKESGRLGVLFDLEGTCALGDQLSMIEMYYALGVRWMLMAYNKNNSVSGGCQDEDTGLTAFGRQVLDEMGRVGMVPCCSHTGWKSARDVLGYVKGPVIFSHSNAYAVHAHPRNIPDDLIKACAATGGVVGVNGIGRFLGDNDNRTETWFRHVDHMVQLVGPDHVGLGLDYVFDVEELKAFYKSRPDMYPSAKPSPTIEPERLPHLVQAMLDHEYPEEAIVKILGGNHLRVAATVWE